MTDNTVFKLTQPGTFSDPLTEVLRSGARALLVQAVEAEVAAFLDSHTEERIKDGRRRVVRHGHLPEREIMTGIGPVSVRAPRVRDRAGQGEARIRFTSAMLPRYARRYKLAPWSPLHSPRNRGLALFAQFGNPSRNRKSLNVL